MRWLLGILLGFCSFVALADNEAIGLIIDDVSGDLTCSQSTCTSKGLSLMAEGIEAAGAENKVKTRDLYLLPDFASFTVKNIIENPGFSPALTCDSSKIATDFLFNYTSIPLFNLNVIPDAKPVVGGCIEPNVVIQSYKTQAEAMGFKNVYMMPMFNGSNDSLVPSDPKITIDQFKDKLTQGALNIAKVINGEGAVAVDGVSFDIENPSFDKNSIEYFLLPLAEELNKSSKPVLVFALQYPLLHQITDTPPGNLVAMPALYDYGMSPDASQYPYQPLTIETYKTQTNAVVTGFTVDPNKKNLPIFFVLSGAGSMELWTNNIVYNQDLCTGKCDLENIKTGAGTGVVQNANCQIGSDQMPENLSPIIKEFLGGVSNFNAFKSNCVSFDNQNVDSMADYVGSAMDVVYGVEKTESFSQNFKGFIVYNEKPKGFFAISCSKKAPGNLYGSATKACGALYPEGIGVETWTKIFTQLQ